tara:strand:- start:674 stop:847 length:174 start_codon:yes stop_codon:yes gene_type:complete
MHIQTEDTRNSYDAQIPEFMKWAQQRIAREVKENEELADKYGTADIHSPFIKNEDKK